MGWGMVELPEVNSRLYYLNPPINHTFFDDFTIFQIVITLKKRTVNGA